MKIKSILLIACLLASAYSEDRKSSFSAALNNPQTLNPAGEIGSFVDAEGSIHIAWIEDKNTGNTNRKLMYTTILPNGDIGPTANITGIPTGYSILHPSVITDKMGTVYIAFFMQKVDGSIKSGKYAIMCAQGNNGSFTLSRVSTNPEDPNLDTENKFNCYVNGRPTAALDEQGRPWIFYVTDHTSYLKNSYAGAVLEGGTWTPKLISEIDANISGTNVSLPKYINSDSVYFAYNNITDGTVACNLLTGTSTTKIVVFKTGYYDIESPTMTRDLKGKHGIGWYDGKSKSMYFAEVNGTTVSTPRIHVTDPNAYIGGTVKGTNVDLETGKHCHFYNSRISSKEFTLAAGTAPRVLKDVNRYFIGQENFFVRNGFAYAVLCSEDADEITALKMSTSGETSAISVVSKNGVQLRLLGSKLLIPHARQGDIAITSLNGRVIANVKAETASEGLVVDLSRAKLDFSTSVYILTGTVDGMQFSSKLSF